MHRHVTRAHTSRNILRSALVLACVSAGLLSTVAERLATAQETVPDFLQFVRSEAARLRSGDAAPESLAVWQKRRIQIREQLEQAWGGFPSAAVPLQPRVLGTLQRDGYRIEKILFQTLPDIWMTANAYVPQVEGARPAVLCVHGHWRGAKQDPHVQARCIGLAKLGFFVLAVDAMGAGERGVERALGEYHGDMVAATLLPLGQPLSGLQVYENMRAVDYLVSRPEVDAERLGITGASGGGNQSMYAGAWDERFKAVVPVCSVGNYQAYLGAACCMCEVVPGALTFTEEAGVLSLVAPRALLVISATRDAFQFSVGEAQKSIRDALPVFRLYDREAHLKHQVFESAHDYNQPMREAMYGWMTLHLAEQGDGSPIPEPAMQLEDPETLRCYPGETRPADWLTLPQYAAREARKILQQWPTPGSTAEWNKLRNSLRQTLESVMLPGVASQTAAVASTRSEPSRITFTLEPEPGVRLAVVEDYKADEGNNQQKSTEVILLTLDDDTRPEFQSLHAAITGAGYSVVTFDLRGTGDNAVPRDKIGRAVDHNTAEWSLWIGRPLLCQWVCDVRAVLNALQRHGRHQGQHVVIVAEGPAGLVAVCAAAMDDRIQQVVTTGTMASFVTETPYVNQRLGTLVPGILQNVGDVPHLAALMAPRKLCMISPVDAESVALNELSARETFAITAQLYALQESSANFQVLPASDNDAILKLLP